MKRSRKTFMERVRAAVAHRPAGQASAELPPAVDARRAWSGTDLVALFCARAMQAGAETATVAMSDVGRHVADLLEQMAARQALIEPALFCAEQIRGALHDRVSAAVAGDTDRFHDADAGVSGVMMAVAETGSVVCRSGLGQSLFASLAAAVHIAVVRGDQIVADLVDVFDALGEQPLPSQTTIITGPSKTADIEGTLITGVHGPGRVHICVVT